MEEKMTATLTPELIERKLGEIAPPFKLQARDSWYNAHVRALKLLWEYLTPQEREYFATHKFLIIGPAAAVRYILLPRWASNIFKLRYIKTRGIWALRGFCITQGYNRFFQEAVPIYDHLLGMVLLARREPGEIGRIGVHIPSFANESESMDELVHWLINATFKDGLLRYE
jgi:hypothetical protein